MPERKLLMNEVLNAIKNRRSVRAYEPKRIPGEVLKTIIEAGNQAPSGMNSQPWRFVVVEDEKLHKKMLETAVPNVKKLLESVRTSNPERYKVIMRRFEEMEDPVYYSAPAVIFVIGRGVYADLSCPLACENMMLAAFSHGLGTCWVQFGSFIADNDEIKNALELKDDEKIFGPIVVGYPKGITEPPQKKAPEIKWL